MWLFLRVSLSRSPSESHPLPLIHTKRNPTGISRTDRLHSPSFKSIILTLKPFYATDYWLRVGYSCWQQFMNICTWTKPRRVECIKANNRLPNRPTDRTMGGRGLRLTNVVFFGIHPQNRVVQLSFDSNYTSVSYVVKLDHWSLTIVLKFEYNSTLCDTLGLNR